MTIQIAEIGPDQYPLYDSITSSFLVETIYRVETVDNGLGGFRLIEKKLSEPYVKDYDDGGNATEIWAQQFDITKWGILLARIDDQPVGGAAVAIETSVYPMDKFQREDMAVLWDMRVGPDYRHQGVGKALFKYAADWARDREYGQLGLETQNINVPACRFYAKMGCKLGAIHRFGYAGCPEVAHEAMLLWYYDL